MEFIGMSQKQKIPTAAAAHDERKETRAKLKYFMDNDNNNDSDNKTS